MMLQIADNAITIGSQSAGTGGAIFHEFIGFRSYMSGLGVFYQMGLKHKEKLKVDIEVRPTIEGIQVER
jgi:hypothetical protein